MKINIQRVGTINVVVPDGPIVDEDAEEFVRVIADQLAAPNPRFIVAMQEVPYLDSRGIEGLVEAAADLQKRGGRMRLAAVTQTCREVLELTGQSQRFEFYDEDQTAVRSFL